MASSDVNTEDAENSISSRNKSSSSSNAISDENGGYGVCLVKFGTDAVGGAVMGSVYGFGYVGGTSVECADCLKMVPGFTRKDFANERECLAMFTAHNVQDS